MINGVLRTALVKSIATLPVVKLLRYLFWSSKLASFTGYLNTEHFDVSVRTTLYESLKVLQ